jgi:hypothetical protein
LTSLWAVNLTVDAVVDNDILIKCSAYRILKDLAEAVVSSVDKVGVLDAARFVVPHWIDRKELNDRDGAHAHWNDFLARAERLEPTKDETALATSIEESAARQHLQVDMGESQLLSMAIHRGIGKVVTGDKRCIAGVEVLRRQVPDLGELRGRLICLEQAVALLVTKVDALAIRKAVCGEPAMDIALTICFQCLNNKIQASFYPTGLHSYIEDLRRHAPELLAPGPPAP